MRTNIDIYQKIVADKNDSKHYLNLEISKRFSKIVEQETGSTAAAKKWVKKDHSFEDVIHVSGKLQEKLI